MNINIYKFINYGANGIVAKINNLIKKDIKINLILDGVVIESVSTTENSYLFYIEKSGAYNVDLLFKNKNGILEKSNSNQLSFEINTITELSHHESFENNKKNSMYKPLNILNEKIDGIEKYYIEIKIQKNKSKKVKEKINSDLNLNLNLKLIDFNLNGVHKANELHNYQYFKYDDNSNYDSLIILSKMIEKLDYVDYCCVSPNTTEYSPPNTLINSSASNDFINQSEYEANYITPNFNSLQTYLNEISGMNIRRAWNKNIDGSNVIVRHMDFGIYRNHEDLKNSNITVVHSRPETEDCNHGTASTGCIVATKNNIGVTGIAYGCKYFFYDTGDLDLIVNDAQAGDIISLDIQFLVNDKLLPATTIRSWWERIKILINKGTTVILAAGNGALDLSIPGVMNDFGDNGSMLVGACHHDRGTRVSFSNYNQETSLINSWGDWSVVTTGYSSLQQFPGNDRNYTKDYSGTSSATPLCSGALALLQDYAKRNNVILSAWEMRKLIKLSNYTEGVKDGIGYRPNVDYLFKKIDELILHELSRSLLDEFTNRALFIPLVFNKNKNSSIEYPFNYDNSQIDRVGIVCVDQGQGVTDLIWSEYDYSVVKALIVNEENNLDVIYLRISKTNECGSYSMNSAVQCGSSHPNRFKLLFEYFKEDNPYINKGKYKGVLPLYAKAWRNNDYKLNIMVNIQVE